MMMEANILKHFPEGLTVTHMLNQPGYMLMCEHST